MKTGDFQLIFLAILLFLSISFLGCSFITERMGEKAGEKAIESETGKDVDIKVREGKVKVKGKDGEIELQTGGNLPKDFPEEFPLYSGAELKGTSRTESEGKVYFQVIYETKDEFSKVVNFYKDKLQKSGYKINNATETQESAILYFGNGQETEGMVMIKKETDKTSFTVTLTK